jgi:D-sedoheptulose 7-phosphate isomerase
MFDAYIKRHTESLSSLEADDFVSLWNASRDVLLSTLKNHKKILIAGNGGSAADAQHFAAELVGRFLLDRKGYPALALTTDSSVLTSVGNDYGFSSVFSRQIEALGETGDCFVGITTSGNSENILEALSKARECGLRTIVLTGKDGGAARELADVALVVQASETSHIQEAHLIVYHAWCKSIEAALYENA